jgi:glycosyltransferase-like protein LARGE
MNWRYLPKNITIIKVNCLLNDNQEPYLIVKKSNSLPLFEERFVNYGFNKVEWITNLRYAGFKFYMFAQAFAIDVPHPA